MAVIKPFKALRYTEKAGEISTLVCPPYDIIPLADYPKYTGRNPNNIISAEYPQAVFQDNIYDNAANFVSSSMKNDILRRDEKRSLYIYEIEFRSEGQVYKIKGLITLVKLEEFSKGIILPHEETLSKAKQDRLNLMKSTGCNFSQIYSLYSDGSGIFDLLEKASDGKPEIEFSDCNDNGNIHRLWSVTDEKTITEISSRFGDKKLYIADGHHRYETALNYRNYAAENGLSIGSSEYIPMMLVDLENRGLVVLPTHRIVKNLNSFNRSEIIEKCREYFDISEFLNREKGEIGLEQARREGRTAFVFFTGDNNYTLLTLKDKSVMEKFLPDASDALRGLDVSVLHQLILERIFGIDKANMADQTNLVYTRIADEAIAEVDGQRANCSFLMNPTKVSEIKDVALSGEKMPQKSTYFYPKLITGLVMNKIHNVD